jgi:phage tail-like protein
MAIDAAAVDAPDDESESPAPAPTPTDASGPSDAPPGSSSANPGTPADEALSLRFQVHVDAIGDLGDWQKCEGLTVEYDIFEYREGGENTFVHRLPGRAKYQNIKLTRVINPSSKAVSDWVAKVLQDRSRTTAWVRVLDGSGKQVVQWNVVGAFPARWTGPTLDVTQNQAAIEVLEIAHNGFTAG